ncbi:hypothetical protein E2562_027843 [Oryza meyeriana var. granulata]|uniref:Uncharacterized protein n=1 Tax=Oryza meyeriana var. granulata TaxID=110450 RepID=A0A6G1DQC4_9ORYZ|nr:hypothetical protein E2562_027843 [Oryza meyeriana var. granulata]
MEETGQQACEVELSLESVLGGEINEERKDREVINKDGTVKEKISRVASIEEAVTTPTRSSPRLANTEEERIRHLQNAKLEGDDGMGEESVLEEEDDLNNVVYTNM